MVDSEDSYKVIPINNKCSSVSNKIVVLETNNINNVNQINNQLIASSQYDNVKNIIVKPMYGGNKSFNIIYRNKEYNIISNNEINAIKNILQNKIYKKDYLLNINDSLYIIRANYKNRFKKIY